MDWLGEESARDIQRKRMSCVQPEECFKKILNICCKKYKEGIFFNTNWRSVLNVDYLYRLFHYDMFSYLKGLKQVSTF